MRTFVRAPLVQCLAVDSCYLVRAGEFFEAIDQEIDSFGTTLPDDLAERMAALRVRLAGLRQGVLRLFKFDAWDDLDPDGPANDPLRYSHFIATDQQRADQARRLKVQFDFTFGRGQQPPSQKLGSKTSVDR